MGNYGIISLKTDFLGLYPVAIGGFCLKGYESKCEEKMTEISNYCLKKTYDEIFLDSQLAFVLKLFSIPQLIYVSATIAMPGLKKPCGGVSGKIKEVTQSASSELVRFEDGIYGFALPGSCSCLMQTTEKTAEHIFDCTKETAKSLPLLKNDIQKILSTIKDESGDFIFTSDGSGGSVGCLFTKYNCKEVEYWI